MKSIGLLSLALFLTFSAVGCSSSKNSRLISAARAGNAQQVKALLEDGAYIDAQDQQGWTAYAAASTNGHLEVMNVLRKAGAKSTIDIE